VRTDFCSVWFELLVSVVFQYSHTYIYILLLRHVLASQVIILGMQYACPSRDDEVSTMNHVACSRFNREAEKQCILKGCKYVDINDELYDYKSQRVKHYFIADPPDNHCSSQRLMYLWHHAIKKATDSQWCPK
jgi:hypothetical protein